MEVSDLKKLLRYNAKTGEFTWKPRKCASFNTKFAGQKAGWVHTSGNRKSIAINVGGKKYYAHVLAWAIKTGEWPTESIDHINHNPLDNRFCNLRQVKLSENLRNRPMRRDNRSGVTGVYWLESRKCWRTEIKVDGVLMFTAQSKNKNVVVRRRRQKLFELGYHKNHGRRINRNEGIS